MKLFRMGFVLHQSGHGHSHGGLSHKHSHGGEGDIEKVHSQKL